MGVRAPRRRVAFSVAAIVVVAAFVGCVNSPRSNTDSVSRNASLAEQVRALQIGLDCTHVTTWRGDPYFWDGMRGVDCYTELDAPVFIRVYAHSDSVAQVLGDWAGIFVDGRSVVYGAGWFVIGPRAVISHIAATHDGAGPTVELPKPLPLSPTRDERTTCVRFLSGSVQDAVQNRKQFAQELPVMDRIYPGAERAVRGITTRDTIAKLEDTPVAELPARLGDFANELNAVCASAIHSTQKRRGAAG